MKNLRLLHGTYKPDVGLPCANRTYVLAKNTDHHLRKIKKLFESDGVYSRLWTTKS